MGSPWPTLTYKPTPSRLQWASPASRENVKRPSRPIRCCKIYQIHKLTSFRIRIEKSNCNLLKGQILSLGRHSKKYLILRISFTLLSSLPQIRKSCDRRRSPVQSLVTCSGQKFRHFVILTDLAWLPKDIIQLNADLVPSSCFIWPAVSEGLSFWRAMD